ncbi:MAG: hypothetical protein LBT38_07320 [Deltaproteobacteria bacterium]|jgi:hypothetical protein|nr:hypothetical protein [Deltaproteobacteria bacterium]
MERTLNDDREITRSDKLKGLASVCGRARHDEAIAIKSVLKAAVKQKYAEIDEKFAEITENDAEIARFRVLIEDGNF